MNTMKKVIPPVAGVLVGALVMGGVWYGTNAASGANKVIATVGSTKITQSALATASQQYAGAQMLSQLISNQLISDAAKKANITATQSELNQALQNIEQQNGITSAAQLSQLLTQSGMTKAQLMDQLKYTVLEQKLVYGQVHVTSKEINTYYNQNKANLGTPEQRAISDIVVKDKATAQHIQSQVNQGTSFASLAKKYSTDSATKSNGGAMGTFSESELSQINPTIVSPAFALKQGQVSSPIQVSGQYELVQVTKITPAKIPTLSSVKSTIVKDIQQQNAQPAANYIAALLKKENVQILDPMYTSVKTQLANPAPPSSSAPTGP